MKKSLSTGCLVNGFVLRVPDSHWSLQNEATLSDSDSEDEHYLDDNPEVKHEPGPCESDKAEEEPMDSESDTNDQDKDTSEEKARKARRELVAVHKALFSLCDNYRLLEQVTSASTTCYKVLDPEHGVMVLKICKLRGPIYRPPKEVRCMLRCAHIPNVLPLVRWHALADRFYGLLMPWAEDDGLDCVIGRPHKIRSYLRQALGLLDACLQAGVMHRDVKPGNLFWQDETGTLTLTDFDCATVYPGRVRKDSVGTRGFMSPEMRSGRGYTWKHDVYSLGVSFGMLLYGIDDENVVTDQLVATWYKPSPNKKVLRKQKRRHQVLDEPARPFQGTPAARALLRRLIAKDPNDRPTYAEALADPYFSTD